MLSHLSHCRSELVAGAKKEAQWTLCMLEVRITGSINCTELFEIRERETHLSDGQYADVLPSDVYMRRCREPKMLLPLSKSNKGSIL